MLEMCRELGFSIVTERADPNVMRVRKTLAPELPPSSSA